MSRVVSRPCSDSWTRCPAETPAPPATPLRCGVAERGSTGSRGRAGAGCPAASSTRSDRMRAGRTRPGGRPRLGRTARPTPARRWFRATHDLHRIRVHQDLLTGELALAANARALGLGDLYIAHAHRPTKCAAVQPSGQPEVRNIDSPSSGWRRIEGAQAGIEIPLLGQTRGESGGAAVAFPRRVPVPGHLEEVGADGECPVVAAHRRVVE